MARIDGTKPLGRELDPREWQRPRGDQPHGQEQRGQVLASVPDHREPPLESVGGAGTFSGASVEEGPTGAAPGGAAGWPGGSTLPRILSMACFPASTALSAACLTWPVSISIVSLWF